MRKILLIMCLLLSGCASYVRPLAPAPEHGSIRTIFRNTAEVIVVMPCQRNDRTIEYNEYTTWVQDVYTGERFSVRGCVGKVNDRFRLSYY